MASGRLVDYLGQGPIADRPASLDLTTGAVGLWFATDTDVLSAWDGATWTDTSAGGSGTVSSVALTAPSQFVVAGSPITTSGSLGLAWNNQTANTVLSGPASGGAAAPTYRALAAADLPLGTTVVPGALQPDGTTITVVGGVISAVGGGGSGDTAFENTMYRSGYYTPFQMGANTGAFSVTSKAIASISLLPVFVPKAVTVTPSFSVSTAQAASNGVLAVYDQNPSTGLPLNLLYTSGAIPTTTIGIKQAGTTVALSPGTYWAAFGQDVATLAVRCLVNANGITSYDQLFGVAPTSLGTATSQPGLTHPWTAPTMPSTLTAGSLTPTTAVPIVFFLLP